LLPQLLTGHLRARRLNNVWVLIIRWLVIFVVFPMIQ
jgi:hypothetical protein